MHRELAYTQSNLVFKVVTFKLSSVWGGQVRCNKGKKKKIWIGNFGKYLLHRRISKALSHLPQISQTWVHSQKILEKPLFFIFVLKVWTSRKWGLGKRLRGNWGKPYCTTSVRWLIDQGLSGIFCANYLASELSASTGKARETWKKISVAKTVNKEQELEQQ